MQYPVEIKGFEGQDIAVEAAGFFSGPKLLVNGEPAPKGPKRGQFSLTRNDGSEAVAKWQASLGTFGGVPQLKVGDELVSITEPLKWYEMVWCLIPFTLIGFGGLIGGVLGAIAFTINSNTFRSEEQSAAMKWVITAGVTVAAFVLYFVVASAIGSLF